MYICKTSVVIRTSGNLAAIWISNARRSPTKSEVQPLERLTPKTCVAVRILSLCALELEICLGPFHLPVAGERRKKPLPGE